MILVPAGGFLVIVEAAAPKAGQGVHSSAGHSWKLSSVIPDFRK